MKKLTRWMCIVVVGILVCTIIACGVCLVYKLFIEPRKTIQTMSELQSMHETEVSDNSSATTELANTETTETPEMTEQAVLSNFLALQERNADIAGWIYSDACGIDYPVMQCKENQDKYLRLSFDGEYDYNGTPYLSKESNINPQSQVMVVYGHNMKNGMMFGGLTQYKDIEFVRENPVLEFETLYEHGSYKVIAVLNADSNFEREGWCYAYTEYSSNEFQDFLFEIRSRSYFQISDRCDEADRYLLLSTCDYDFDGERFVVVLRKLDTNETVSADMYQANSLVRMPKQYYSVIGGIMPSETEMMDNYEHFYCK